MRELHHAVRALTHMVDLLAPPPPHTAVEAPWWPLLQQLCERVRYRLAHLQTLTHLSTSTQASVGATANEVNAMAHAVGRVMCHWHHARE